MGCTLSSIAIHIIAAFQICRRLWSPTPLTRQTVALPLWLVHRFKISCPTTKETLLLAEIALDIPRRRFFCSQRISALRAYWKFHDTDSLFILVYITIASRLQRVGWSGHFHLQQSTHRQLYLVVVGGLGRRIKGRSHDFVAFCLRSHVSAD